jgi:hypothetical protein
MRRPARIRPQFRLAAQPGGPAEMAGLLTERMRRARAAQAAAETRRTVGVVAAAFLLFVFLSVSLVHASIASVPIRALYGVGLLGLLLLACPVQLAQATRKQRNTLLVIVGFAALGGAVSAAAGSPPTAILRQILEIHVQASVNLLVAATVMEVCGPRTLVRAFVGVIGLSMVVALLQAAGVEPAWALRGAVGTLLDSAGVARDRASGLSLNPVLLGSQTCLAIAMLYMWQRYSRSPNDLRPDPAVLFICVAALAVAVASGTRSPIMGILAFLAIYMTRRFGAWAVVAGLIAVALLPLGQALLEHFRGSGLRVLQTDDKSAVGRWPLLVYGVRLFLTNPLGYGLDFDPRDHWAAHWSALAHLKNAVVIRSFELHNYPLNTLNKYGAGLLLFLPLILALVGRHRAVLLGFAPYAFHIFFHNDGPLDTDYMIWFVIALTSMRASGESPVRLSPGPKDREKRRRRRSDPRPSAPAEPAP